MPDDRTAVVFLARGYEPDYRERFDRFLVSYAAREAGEAHKLYVIFKGFRSPEEEVAARTRFETVDHVAHAIDDAGFDIGAYASLLPRLSERWVCFFNSNAEIVADGWLRKLISNLDDPAVGMVGATGSYESLHFLYADFPKFPNPHLRTNAFALRVSDAERLFPGHVLADKTEAWRFESGEAGLTRRLSSEGLVSLIVGRDGRGYSPDFWSQSETYRLGLQGNLLVSDNVTRQYQSLSPGERALAVHRTWGRSVPTRMISSRNHLSGRNQGVLGSR